jgi:mono/diheme cytochrome c family protein
MQVKAGAEQLREDARQGSKHTRGEAVMITVTRVLTFSIASVAAFLLTPSPSRASEDVVGRSEYLNSCAACHGEGGDGNGPVAQHLNVKPADLTRMAERNGGEFPFLEAFQIVDGRTTIRGHGDRTMPIWGLRYRAEAGYDEQPINRMAAETIIRARVLELVNYLQAIQQPGGEEATIIGRVPQ